VDARRLGLLAAWAVVGATYALGGIPRATRTWWGTLGSLVLLLVLVGVTLAVESSAPATRARRWRLAWGLGAFHVASCAVVGATSGFLFSFFVALDTGSRLRPEPLVARTVILAGGILLAGAALRAHDLAGRGADRALALRAVPAGAAMGVVVAGAWSFFTPFALLYAVPVGIVWALGYWALDTAVASVARAST